MNTPLKQIRIDKSKSIYDVAKAADCSPSTISRIERMEGEASPKLAERISKYFEGAITEEQILYPQRFVATQ